MGDNPKMVKIVVFAPETHADAVREAMGKAGAGKMGNYSFCSFSAKGIGRFKPEKVKEILAKRHRSSAGQTAPAKGLCLEEVFY